MNNKINHKIKNNQIDLSNQFNYEDQFNTEY